MGCGKLDVIMTRFLTALRFPGSLRLPERSAATAASVGSLDSESDSDSGPRGCWTAWARIEWLYAFCPRMAGTIFSAMVCTAARSPGPRPNCTNPRCMISLISISKTKGSCRTNLPVNCCTNRYQLDSLARFQRNRSHSSLNRLRVKILAISTARPCNMQSSREARAAGISAINSFAQWRD